MTKEKITVRDLAGHLLHLIENGHGDKNVRVSVNYDHCDHMQPLSEVWSNDSLDWIILIGGKE